MEVKVRFRFNKATGEVEVFQVDDVGEVKLSEAEHNRLHNRLTASVASVIERNPRIHEVQLGDLARGATLKPGPKDEEADTEPTVATEEGLQAQ